MSALFHRYLCGRKAAEWLIDMKDRKYSEDEEFGLEMYDTSEPEIGPDEPAIEGYGLSDPAEREIDSILREFTSSGSEEPRPGEATGDEAACDSEYRDDDEEDDHEYPASGDELVYGFSKPRKSRTKRLRRKKIKRKGTGLLGIPHFISSMIIVALVIIVGVTLARILWLWADDVLALTKEDRPVTVKISDSDTMEDITNKLAEADLIRYPGLFNMYCDITGAREKISAGEFQLNEMLDYMALVNSMSSYSSTRTEVSVMIPEGYECRQIFELLEKNGVCTVEELETAAKTVDINDYWFLEGLTEEDRDNPYCLEGFLFPDTYNFYMADDSERVLRKFLRNFDNRFDDDMVEAIDTLNEMMQQKLSSYGYGEEYIQEQRLDVMDVVNIAAMIERETAGSGESATIASVICNRLCNPNYPYLNIDATIQYALGDRKATLTYEDLEIDSPYNTYLYPGLPVGPISNPGLNSLRAALNPADTDYYFYALDVDGMHHFSRNKEEHEAFLASLKGED